MRHVALLVLPLLLVSSAPRESRGAPATAARSGAALVQVSTTFSPLPSGAGKELAEQSCVACHSSDMLAQQRLTEAQWTAVVEKMMGWGAAVAEEQKAPLIRYLSAHFGPENRFRPIEVGPLSK